MTAGTDQLEPLTVSVAEAKRLSGLGTTTLYYMMGDGRLDRRKIGGRTLITYASLKKLLGFNDEAQAS